LCNKVWGQSGDTKQYLRECVNTLLRAKQGDLTFFVGINWVDHWLGHHKDQLQKYWNTSLDSTCAKALNPTTVVYYFSKLQTSAKIIKLWELCGLQSTPEYFRALQSFIPFC